MWLPSTTPGSRPGAQRTLLAMGWPAGTRGRHYCRPSALGGLTVPIPPNHYPRTLPVMRAEMLYLHSVGKSRNQRLAEWITTVGSRNFIRDGGTTHNLIYGCHLHSLPVDLATKRYEREGTRNVFLARKAVKFFPAAKANRPHIPALLC